MHHHKRMMTQDMHNFQSLPAQPLCMTSIIMALLLGSSLLVLEDIDSLLGS